MSENFEETCMSETVDRNYLIVKIAYERVKTRGGNTMNQNEMKAALEQTERDLADVN